MGLFFPRPYTIEAICNPVELWYMGSTPKVPLFLWCHCLISVLDKWQHFDLFFLTTERGQNGVLCHYGNHCKYTVVSGDVLEISLPAGFSFPSQLPADLESWSSYQAAFKAISVATLAVILPTAAAWGMGREDQWPVALSNWSWLIQKKALSGLRNKLCVEEDCAADSKDQHGWDISTWYRALLKET